MAREDPHFRLRFPDELRVKVADAAKANRRSMTAEILDRVESTFDKDLSGEQFSERYGHLLEEAFKQGLAAAGPAEGNTLYVLLDGEGVPSSWPEIMAHLNFITQAGGIEYKRIDAAIIGPDIQSSSGREEQWLKLREDYKKRIREARRGEGQKHD